MRSQTYRYPEPAGLSRVWPRSSTRNINIFTLAAISKSRRGIKNRRGSSSLWTRLECRFADSEKNNDLCQSSQNGKDAKTIGASYVVLVHASGKEGATEDTTGSNPASDTKYIKSILFK